MKSGDVLNMSDFEKFYADERFTRDEMKAIYDGMDRSDYSQYSHKFNGTI
jgi:hypothetical protein